MSIDFRQFLHDSVEKVLFKADFFFCMTEMRRLTLAHNLNIQCILYAHVHNAIVQWITTETSFRTAALYSKCQLAKYLTVKQFKPSVER